ncbi:MAG: ABC transporter ATP-binding protein [Candidatus Pacebacteria bacterium]|nr:ABC transporter ATP-binding protein [Candidatus Paceibacterota bacterium]
MKRKRIVIELKNISKTYVLRDEKPTLIEAFFKTKKNTYRSLNKINLKIKKGEKVGIIGPNGSGKTTLLKILAGITKAEGKMKRIGKTVSLIDLEAGFYSDLTGHENILLNGLIIGMSKKEIEEKYDEIINFADIGEFIHSPMYTYSSGMKLRLGFSVVTHSDPDILLLDESLSVGDQDFREKSFSRIKEFFNMGKTVIIVSHYMRFMKLSCDRVIWIENGSIKMDGPAKKIIDAYEKNAQENLKL